MTEDDEGEEHFVSFPFVEQHVSFFTGFPAGSKVWERLEALTRNAEMTESIRAEIRDPAWMLGRQWQIGEFSLEDAGSPVDAELTVEHDEVTRVRLGDSDPMDYDKTTDGPLETLVEHESVLTGEEMDSGSSTTSADRTAAESKTTPNTRHRAEAGQYFLRLLAAKGVTRTDGEPYTAADFADTLSDSAEEHERSLHLQTPDGDLDAEAERYVTVMAGGDGDARILDGIEAIRRLRPAIEHGWERADHLPVPADVNADNDHYQNAAEAYYDWYRKLYDEPTETPNPGWDPQRFEYDFAVSTGSEGTETYLTADEYSGGRLDWDAFSAEDGTLDPPEPADAVSSPTESPQNTSDETASLEPETDQPARTTETHRNVLPTPIKFHGMPAPRWWEFEDSSVNLEELSAVPESLNRLLMLEFATIYGNDWFTIPIDETPVGTLSRITKLSITDTFGVTTGGESDGGSIPVADDDWNMFMVDLGRSEAGETAEKGLFLPPTLADIQESDPVERLLLARDEMANVGFAIERLVEGPAGLGLNREEYHRPQLAVQTIRPSAEPDKESVVLENVGSTQLNANDWVIEADSNGEPEGGSSEALYTFPPTPIPPGASVTVVTGSPPTDADGAESGSDEADLYWKRAERVWADAVHLLVKDPTGRIVERVRVPPLNGSLLPAYRLATSVPDHWFPLKPIRPERGADADYPDVYRFRLAKLLDAEAFRATTSELPNPLGEILTDSEDVAIYEEEITRAGVELIRSYQLASWLDGSRYLWSGRRAGTGRGEGSSGLQFDVLDE